MLEPACPELTPAELGSLPVGQRDVKLIQLRELMFGPRLACVSACPQCGEEVEMEFSTRDLAGGPAPENGFIDGAARFRLPNTLDLIAACQAGSPEAGRSLLVERCIEGAASLPEPTLAVVLTEMEQADPQARMELDVSCPVCRTSWLELFDIVPFLWRELEAQAKRIFREVHTLASVYGWSEHDILAMSMWRRQLYMAMVGG